MSGDEAGEEAHELQYERFCTYSLKEVLGAEVQGQYFYIVQPYKISVYEYYIESKKPQLIQELIYNRFILNYSINEFYICIQTSSFVEVRDRHNWNKLIYTHPILQIYQKLILLLSQHSLCVQVQEDNELKIERISIIDKQTIDVVSLGSLDRTEKCQLSVKPIFLKQMGSLQDFYIWRRSQRVVQMGMLYLEKQKYKKKFELTQIQLNQNTIHNIYHHRITCKQSTRQSTQHVILITEAGRQKQISIYFYQILPKRMANQQESPQILQDLTSLIEHIGGVQKLASQSPLVDEVFSQAFEKNYEEEEMESQVEIKLDSMFEFQSSFYSKGKLWIFSSNKICQIQLVSEATIEDMIKSYDCRQNKFIRTISFQDKLSDKKAIGIYQNNPLFIEQTTSFLISFQKQYTQSIAEEIIEDHQNEENIDNLPLKQGEKDIEELRKNIIDITLTQHEKQSKNTEKEKEDKIPLDHLLRTQSHKSALKRHDKKRLESKVYSQTHHQLKAGTAEVGIQTNHITHRIDDLEQVEMLIAKYSSAVSVSCSRLKQNQFQKEKFDKEITLIVQQMAKSIVEPFLEQQFVSLIDKKTKELSSNISIILNTQLEALNETMRKIQVKENNLKGKKIYDYSKQVQNIKNSVSGVIDCFKEREINKLACNELILEEARALTATVQNIEKQIKLLNKKNQTTEVQISNQIQGIMELLQKIQSEEEKEEGEDEELSGNENSQGEKDLEGSEEQFSQKQGFQEKINQGRFGYPEYMINQYPSQHHGKSSGIDRRYQYPGYYPQFPPPPPPPNPNYYYPYAPRPATVPFPPFYPPPLGPPPLAPSTIPKNPYSSSSSVVSKKSKIEKKGK